MSLQDEIKEYYEKRGLVWPDIWSAMGWANCELGEVYEVLLGKKATWVINHPEDHEDISDQKLAEELGDTIFMLLVAGIEAGVDPIQAIRDKMQRKLEETKAAKVLKSHAVLEEANPKEEMWVEDNYGKFEGNGSK